LSTYAQLTDVEYEKIEQELLLDEPNIKRTKTRLRVEALVDIGMTRDMCVYCTHGFHFVSFQNLKELIQRNNLNSKEINVTSDVLKLKEEVISFCFREKNNIARFWIRKIISIAITN
jgi:hypothetical protein